MRLLDGPQEDLQAGLVQPQRFQLQQSRGLVEQAYHHALAVHDGYGRDAHVDLAIAQPLSLQECIHPCSQDRRVVRPGQIIVGPGRKALKKPLPEETFA